MTSRRKNVRDVMFFAIFPNKERKKSQKIAYSPAIEKKV